MINCDHDVILNRLIELTIRSQYDSISNEEINIKCEELKRRVLDSPYKFHLLPELETKYDNSNEFVQELKQEKKFKYYCLRRYIVKLWKFINGIEIDLSRMNEIFDFEDLLELTLDELFDYLSVRLNGEIVNELYRNTFKASIRKKNYKEGIELIENISKEKKDLEFKKANNYLLSIQRKPKVLVAIAYLKNDEQYFIDKMFENLEHLKEHNPLIDFTFVLEDAVIKDEGTDYTPWSKVTKARNLILSKNDVKQYDYLLSIDSDIVDYEYTFPTRAIGLYPNSIVSPIMLIQNNVDFYDTCGYQKKDKTFLSEDLMRYTKKKFNSNTETPDYPRHLLRTIDVKPPYIQEDPSTFVEVDCVGCFYIAPSFVFQNGYGKSKEDLLRIFKIAQLNDHKIYQDIVQYEDHPFFTDHYTICAAMRGNGYKVYLDRGSVAYHADLSIYGKSWH